MLEYHSRLHHLDVKRQRQQQRKQEAAAAAAAAAAHTSRSSSSRSSSGGGSGPYTVQHPVLQEAAVSSATAAAGVQQPEASGFSLEHEAAEQLEEGCCNDAASDVQVRKWLVQVCALASYVSC
jgi:hypothetical protein